MGTQIQVSGPISLFPAPKSAILYIWNDLEWRNNCCYSNKNLSCSSFFILPGSKQRHLLPQNVTSALRGHAAHPSLFSPPTQHCPELPCRRRERELRELAIRRVLGVLKNAGRELAQVQQNERLLTTR